MFLATIFRAGTVAQYNIFLRMCEVTTHIHHGYVSLSLIYITSESTIYGEFHTILWSKINTKFQLQVSPVQNLQRRSPLRCSTCSRFNLSSSTSSTRSTVPSALDSIFLVRLPQLDQQYLVVTLYSSCLYQAVSRDASHSTPSLFWGISVASAANF